METELKRISVIGLGKLGVPLAATLAWKGFATIGVDLDAKKIEILNQGSSFLYEPELREMIVATNGRLRATADFDRAISESDVTFILVPTPSEEDGTFSLVHVLHAVKKMGEALRFKDSYHLVILTSTVMPGATETKVKTALEKHSGKKCGKDFGLCYNPEFVALGSVIQNLLNPDFILIGESDSEAGAMLERLYKRFCENNPPVVRMNFVNAELTKLAVNAFVTNKITFANMLARLCEKLPGANVDIVTSTLGLDSRIGGKYLKGSVGYGGPCFPRDNRALTALAYSLGAPTQLPEATDSFNRVQVPWLANLIKSYLPKGGRVGILGLSYKPHSDVVEEAQGFLLAKMLSNEGITTIVYDPAALDTARKALDHSTLFVNSAKECVRKANVIVITTPWEEFGKLSTADFSGEHSSIYVIDCWRILGHLQGTKGIEYIPLGVGISSHNT